MFSVIIPTYNRSYLLRNAVDSALKFFRHADCLYEIVIVDDCSTDDTHAVIFQNYEYELSCGLVNYYTLAENLGVTGAKNFGFANAKYDFLIFLDSDDELVGRFADMKEDCVQIKNNGIGFFRCSSLETNRLIGPSFVSAKLIGKKDYYNINPFPECLPVIHRKIFEKISYSTELRGFEGILYMRHLFEGGLIYLSPKILRRYRQLGSDTISSSAKSKDRLAQLAKGSKAMASLALNHRQFRFFVKYFCRFVYYKVRSFLL